MRFMFKLVLAAVVGATLSLNAQNDPIIIGGHATHLIPVSISGFSGEAESVLKFDLSVLGIVVQQPADYTITGRDDGRVEGTLSGGGRTIFSRA